MRSRLSRWPLTAAMVLSAASLFADPILKSQQPEVGLSFADALQRAEQQAPSLAATSAGVRAAQSAAIAAPALPDPKLVFGVDNVPVSGADRGSFSRDFMTMERIGVMQEFPNGDRRHARADIAAAATEKAQAEQVIERLKIRQATASAWLRRWYLEQQLALYSELDRDNRHLIDAAHAQLSSGKGSAIDALTPAQAAADLADRRDELLQAIAQTKSALRRWLGDDAELPLSGEAPHFVFDPNQLQQHLHHHPELAAYGPLTDIATAELREAEAEKKPGWGVELDYQRRAAPYSDMVSLQFTMDLPVFSGARQTPRIEAKRQALLQLDGEREAMLRAHRAELDSDVAQYTLMEQQLARMTATRLPLAQQKIDVLMASYRSGQSDLTALLTARREWIEQRIKQLDIQNQQAALAAKLYFAYGESMP